MKTLLIAAGLLISIGLSGQIQDTTYTLPTKAATTPELSVKQCAGTTKTGQRCRYKVFGTGDHCKIHDPNATKCGAVTQKGKPCQIRVKKDGDKCHHHRK